VGALAPAVRADTYVWAQPTSELRPEIWSYETFVRENAWKWVGDGAADNEDYMEVEERRAMNGTIVRVAGEGEIVMEVNGVFKNHAASVETHTQDVNV
jgi:hypothetical protein